MKEENLDSITEVPLGPAPRTGAPHPNAPIPPTTFEVTAEVPVPVEVPVEVPVPAVTTPTEIVDAVSISSKSYYASYTTAPYEAYQKSDHKYTICGGIEKDTFYACDMEKCPVNDIETVCKPLNTCSCDL